MKKKLINNYFTKNTLYITNYKSVLENLNYLHDLSFLSICVTCIHKNNLSLQTLVLQSISKR